MASRPAGVFSRGLGRQGGAESIGQGTQSHLVEPFAERHGLLPVQVPYGMQRFAREAIFVLDTLGPRSDGNCFWVIGISPIQNGSAITTR